MFIQGKGEKLMSENKTAENTKNQQSDNILEVSHLKKYFPIKGGMFGKQVGAVKAVDDVSFTLKRGTTMGLVGESGCGKSTTGRTILRLIEKTDGQVLFNGKDVYGLSNKEMRDMRTKMQIIFQDPYSSLNPRMTVEDIIGEGIDIHGLYKGEERRQRIHQLLEMVGLNKEHALRFPHEFSGGQRQRIGIARALAIEPEFIVCDEPISALDVSIQAQVVNLLIKLQKELGLTYLFIAHDLSMVKHISDRVGVMYLGTMVEMTTSEELYTNPAHPYTKALLSAIPIPDPKVEHERQRIMLSGDVPSPINPASGCRFKGRCPYASAKCSQETPVLHEIAPKHYVACHLY